MKKKATLEQELARLHRVCTTKRYNISVTEEQCRVIATACELLARIGMGQFQQALERMPIKKKIDWCKWHSDVATIGELLKKYNHLEVDGYHSSLGIGMLQVPIESRMAYEIYRAIRKFHDENDTYMHCYTDQPPPQIHSNGYHDVSDLYEEKQIMPNMDKSFADLRKNNAIVSRILDAGGTPEDCCIGLAEALQYATDQCMKYIAIAPRKIRLPDGTVKVWRCPDEYVPFMEPLTGTDNNGDVKS